MKYYALHREQHLSRPLSEVFAFFGAPENLALLTPPTLGFQILSPQPVAMRAGAKIDYRIKLFGVPLRWKTLITLYDPPHRFIDEQIRGPYAFWHHLHEFRAEGDRTWMRDEVRYALPFGILGRAMHGLWVKRQLQGIFDYRQAQVELLFSTRL